MNRWIAQIFSDFCAVRGKWRRLRLMKKKIHIQKLLQKYPGCHLFSSMFVDRYKNGRQRSFWDPQIWRSKKKKKLNWRARSKRMMKKKKSAQLGISLTSSAGDVWVENVFTHLSCTMCLSCVHSKPSRLVSIVVRSHSIFSHFFHFFDDGRLKCV